ncbi:RloB family protein [Aliamphritea hakodatensis]|uniref:RloB family protein n=1 Tax=Aliamphritea hakodatensis TaxID=2895352 RepID=UPI0022FD805B|nr:RloB family protein [Aliamphritea hakodatensis]
MGKDNQPKIRQAKKFQRKQGSRLTADRVLIVTEGKETEPNYFLEIRRDLRLQTTSVSILKGKYGTCPKQVVEYAYDLFLKGDSDTDIQPKAFEKIYAVIDRDDHAHYHTALQLAENINNKKLLNDKKVPIEFSVIPSIPNFEIWLLLHFENRQTMMPKEDVYAALSHHIDNYEKGNQNHYSITKRWLDIAIERAESLAKENTFWTGCDLYTDIHLIVKLLLSFKNKN